eukprot:Platyproteum_vivax@DN7614_c0_g1_i8.p1
MPQKHNAELQESESSQSVQEHWEDVKPDGPILSYYCNLCDGTFQTKTDLETHLKKKHLIPHPEPTSLVPIYMITPDENGNQPDVSDAMAGQGGDSTASEPQPQKMTKQPPSEVPNQDVLNKGSRPGTSKSAMAGQGEDTKVSQPQPQKMTKQPPSEVPNEDVLNKQRVYAVTPSKTHDGYD